MNFLKMNLTLAVVFLFSSLSVFSQKSIDLKYDVSTGDQYDYHIVTDQDITFDANGQTMALNQNIEFKLISTVAEVSRDSMEIESKIKKIKMVQSIFGMQLVYDSDDPATAQNPMVAKIAETMGAMVDKSYYVVMDKKGNMLKVNMSELVENDNLSNNLSSGMQFGTYPDHKVKIGDSWETEISPLKTSDMKVKVKYTLLKVSGKKATLGIDGTITANTVEDIDMKMDGTQKGEMIVNTETGWLIESKIDQEIRMDIEQNGVKVPATISGTTTTTSVKMN
ncbi:MAG: hypothetical protein GXO86_11555 [Chlorobi bacterium]|nr:hypothetical protein [Chlorobiota bacterium]